MKKRPTIADVAKNCGVTAATVSRVLNYKKQNFSASAAVRQRIWTATREMGYVPNSSARSLSMGSTPVVGLFAAPQTHVAEGLNEALIEGLAETLHGGGYEVFFGMTPIRTNGSRLPVWRFDGAVLMQGPTIETVEELDVRRVPYVCANERTGHPVVHVLADDVGGMNHAISHLVQLGHRRFAYANVRAVGAMHYSVLERYNTLLAAAADGSIELVPGHETPYSSPVEFLQRAVVQQGATAVITYDHRRAVQLLGVAPAMGLHVPRDFSLICFNDVFPVAMLNPPLTVISVPGREIGRVAADLLLNHLISPRRFFGKEVRISEDLIVRSSTAPPCA